MKNFRDHRVLASISAGTALMLVLSSCAVFSARKEETIPRPPRAPGGFQLIQPIQQVH